MALLKGKEGRLSQIWSFDVGSHLLCGPSVDDLNDDGTEEIIIATKTGKIILLDQDAKPRWEFVVNEKIDEVEVMFMDSESVNSVMSRPKTCDINNDGQKEIVFGTELGMVYALTADGKLLWKYQAGSAVSGMCFCDTNNDGKQEVIFGSDDGNLHVVNAMGKLQWKYFAERGIKGTPTVSVFNKVIVFGDNEGVINCVSFDNKLLWSHKTGGKITAEVVIKNIYGDNKEYIIVGSADNTLYVLDLDGDVIWEYKTNGSILSKVEIDDLDNDGKFEILVSSCDNNIYALNCEGEKIWSYETNFWIGSSAVAVDIDGDGQKEVIVGSYDHNVYVLSAEGRYVLEHIPGLSHIINQAGHYSDIQSQDPGENIGKKIWQFTVPDMIVGLAHIKKTKRIVVGVKTGKVICLAHTKS
ncbi:MAG: PQQ-binding-like beta-propeller repeat protein [Nanoarchaeota archaeon]|nr:PQQ-binding-like beta-propeller repeat protein [Nanoarchaeota archaeon]